MSGVNFYKDLPALQMPVADALQSTHFSEVPSGWFVVIADIKNSTAAVNEGRHNDVNLVAAGSLVAALNVARARNIEIPFFFGGDGGTVLVPGELHHEIIAGLMLHNLNSIRNFNLELRIGSVAVEEMMAAGHSMQLAKLQFGSSIYKPLLLGDGLRFAERLIKGASKAETNESPEGELNLEGLECRWDKIKPPLDENEVVCYLIEANDTAKQAEIYREVLLKIDEIYGSIEKRNPLSFSRLKLLLNFQKIKKEMMAKYGKWKKNYFTTAYLRTVFGPIFFKFSTTGKQYLNQLIMNADTLIIDGRINTIISGKKEKRIKFIEYLNKKEENDDLIYGHHISKESVMTCYIENRNEKHMHFVDGSDGGYTEASKQFKSKLKLT